ncbi:MAG: hypothetical protein K0Q95_1863 [Bacteroidota bacterium]|jgi:hypothetical protein|nr:hypothetical protein [Bacteroidota bacterium]
MNLVELKKRAIQFEQLNPSNNNEIEGTKTCKRADRRIQIKDVYCSMADKKNSDIFRQLFILSRHKLRIITAASAYYIKCVL